MTAIPGGVRVAGFMSPTDDTDVYATHKAIYGHGGYREVADITERDNITVERMSLGMLCYVQSEDKIYKLTQITPAVIWTEVVLGGATTLQLAYDNGNTILTASGRPISIASTIAYDVASIYTDNTRIQLGTNDANSAVLYYDNNPGWWGVRLNFPGAATTYGSSVYIDAQPGAIGQQGGWLWMYAGNGGNSDATHNAGGGGQYDFWSGGGGRGDAAHRGGAGGILSFQAGWSGNNDAGGGFGSDRGGFVQIAAGTTYYANNVVGAAMGGQVDIESGRGGNANTTNNWPGDAGGPMFLHTASGGSGTATLDAGRGGDLYVTSGSGGTANGGNGGRGGHLYITAGTGSGLIGSGGSLYLRAGNVTGTGTNGSIFLADTATSAIQIGNITTNPTTTFKGTGLVDVEAANLHLQGTWNGGHFVMGTYHMWIDALGRLRILNGVPTADTDGEIVGMQS